MYMETTTKTKFEVSGLKVLTAYEIENLMVSAMEGGSNYWYEIKDESYDAIKEATKDMNGEAFVIRMLVAIQRGVSVKVHDCNDEDELLGTITQESWAKAEDLMIKEQRPHLGDVLNENDDATTGDVFFQLAVMGEVKFG